MKTSNKILLGLIAIIFAVPLLLAFALQSKIKNGEYTVQENNNFSNEKNRRTGTLPVVKVVSVMSAHPDFLTCHIRQSNETGYKYYKDDYDSIAVSVSSDTLYIKYLKDETNTNQNKREVYQHFDIDINLPAVTELMVDGSVVVLHSSNFATIPVTLKNNGVVRDGTEKTKKEGVKASAATNNINNKAGDGSVHHKVEVTTREASRKAKNPALEIPTPDVKELLVFSLFYGIG